MLRNVMYSTLEIYSEEGGGGREVYFFLHAPYVHTFATR